MKTKVFVQILILAIFGSSMVQAQENINRQVKKEVKKAKREVRKANKEIKKSMKDVEWEDLEYSLEELDQLSELQELGDIDFDFDFDFEIPELEAISELVEIPEMEGFNFRTPRYLSYRSFYEEEGNVLQLSKDLDNVSISKDFYFDVKAGHNSLDLNVDGTLESGELTIKVTKPDGEVFQEFQISPLADVDWSQKIDMDEEGKVYTGKWTINLKGTGATGNYNIRFKTR